MKILVRYVNFHDFDEPKKSKKIFTCSKCGTKTRNGFYARFYFISKLSENGLELRKEFIKKLEYFDIFKNYCSINCIEEFIIVEKNI